MNSWVVVPFKEPFEFKASQSMALSYIYSLDSDQMGSFRVDEKEQNTACENTQGIESLIEFHASYTFSITHKMFPVKIFLTGCKAFVFMLVTVQ